MKAFWTVLLLCAPGMSLAQQAVIATVPGGGLSAIPAQALGSNGALMHLPMKGQPLIIGHRVLVPDTFSLGEGFQPQNPRGHFEIPGWDAGPSDMTILPDGTASSPQTPSFVILHPTPPIDWACLQRRPSYCNNLLQPKFTPPECTCETDQ
nr:hypothetical protein [uncultured Gellertiella sp.]